MLHFETHIKNDFAQWVVFIHGAGGSIATWNYQLPAFRDHYNLLTIDLRDHGASKDLTPAYSFYSFEIIIKDIEEVLDFLNIQAAHFITLSFGSVLLQALSLRNPNLVTKAVMAGAILSGNVWIRSFVSTARFLNLILTYRQMYELFSRMLMPKKQHRVSRKIYRKQARKLSPAEYMKWLGLYREFFKTLSIFQQSTMSYKMLIAMGKEDFIFLGAARSYALQHQNAELQVIANAGHICSIDQHQNFNEKALHFLLEK